MGILDNIREILFTPGDLKDGSNHTDLPLAGAAWPFVSISIAYAVFVLKIGPMWMKNREPFQLKKIILVYNLVQVLVNLWLFVTAVYFLIMSERDFACVVKVPADNPYKTLEVILTYSYYIIKIVDYMDTIFFVLRKSFKQITFLHVYHHILMGVTNYAYMRTYGTGGHVGLVGVINMLIHAVMYTYYMLSGLRSNARQSLWWKKYITILQMAQFVMLVIIQSWPLLINRDCDFSKLWLMLSTTQAALMLYLFSNFYKNAYMRKDNVQDKKTTITAKSKNVEKIH